MSFAWPTTCNQASEEIDRLEALRQASHAERRRESQTIRRDMASGRGGGAAVRDEELSGYLSTASWGGCDE